jgi:cobalt-zinc-cadmium efflux system membrane fusion protein
VEKKKTEEAKRGRKKSETEVALIEAQFKTIGIETGSIEMKTSYRNAPMSHGSSSTKYGKYINLNSRRGQRYLCIEGTFVSKGKRWQPFKPRSY